MKAVIAAGGRGTRLRPITWTMNKHLIPLANEPMLTNALKKVAAVGITEVALNVNPGEVELMREVFGDGSEWGLTLTYIEQEGGAVGVGHILYNAREWIGGDDVLLYFGDNVVLGSLQGMVDKFYNEALDASFAFVEVPDPQRFGVPEFNADGELVRIQEKPANPPSQYAQTGLYIYKMAAYLQAFDAIEPSARGEYEIADINSHIIANGKAGYEFMTGWWKDTGTVEALLEGNQLLMNELLREDVIVAEDVKRNGSVRIEGRVKIGAGVTLGPNVLIRGPVVIGANVTITDSYIGPSTTIGDGSHIQQTEIEHSIVMSGANLQADTRIVDSIIGPNVTIAPVGDTLPRGHRMVVGENSYVEL